MIKEENLIFLISQPRSGSSLLQQLLINTKCVKSVPEPWLMLALVQTFSDSSIEVGYNPHYTYINFNEYLERFENGKEDFKNEIKQIALKLYNYNVIAEQEIYFLDKTPRYYHIVNELKELFPKAKFIILIRNPISVFSSILEYNFQGNLFKMFKDDRYHDLYTAPRKICSIIKEWDSRSYHLLHYEKLLENPLLEFKNLSNYLKIEFNKSLSYEISEDFLNSRGIDKKGAVSNNEINTKYLNSWKKSINDSLKKKILKDYINKLGADLISCLGYDIKNLSKMVEDHRVKFRFPLDVNYLKYNGNRLSAISFIYSRINNKLNNIIK